MAQRLAVAAELAIGERLAPWPQTAGNWHGKLIRTVVRSMQPGTSRKVVSQAIFLVGAGPESHRPRGE